MSTAEVAGQFVCVGCGKRHPWKPAIAGKKGKCKCGRAMTVPEQPEQQPPTGNESARPEVSSAAVSPAAVSSAASKPTAIATAAVASHRPAPVVAEDLYDLAETETPKPKRAAALPRPEINYASPPGSVVPPGHADSPASYLPYRKKLTEEPKAPPPAPSVLRDIAAPVALIALGIALNLWDASYQGPDRASLPIPGLILPVTIQMLTSVLLVVGAVIGGSAMAGIAFTDPIWKTIVKLCAVSLVPGPVGSLLGHCISDMNGNIAATFSSVALYFLLLWALIRLAIQDYVICVALIWIVRTLVLYVMYRIQSARMGSSI
jgi:hypothetical protein